MTARMFAIVCFIGATGCTTAGKQIGSGATEGALGTVDTKVENIVSKLIADKNPEMLEAWKKEAKKLQEEGDSTPWLTLALSQLWPLLLVVVFGKRYKTLRKLGPIKAVAEVLSSAIRGYTKKNGGGKEMEELIAKEAKAHPDLPDNRSVRDIMKDAGAFVKQD
jgi:hypothetical protein